MEDRGSAGVLWVLAEWLAIERSAVEQIAPNGEQALTQSELLLHLGAAEAAARRLAFEASEREHDHA